MAAIIDDAGGVARTISNDITQLDWSTPRAVQDTTGIDKFAMERLLNIADFQVNMTVIFDDASNMAFDVFKTITSGSVQRTVALSHSGQNLNNEVLFSDCPWSRAQNGELTAKPTGALADGTIPAWS